MKIIYPKNFASSRNEVILQYCKGKKILHIGATDAPYTKAKYQGEIGPLLYREIDKVCISQLAIDIDTESIKFLSDKGNEFPNSQLIAFDMNRLQDLNFTPDVIVFGEVIEHLMNLEIALTNIKQGMTKDTLLIISTPNAHSLYAFIQSLLGFEFLHEDHKVYFSYGYLYNLLKFNKLMVLKGYFTILDEYLYINLNWWKKLIYPFYLLMAKIFRYNTNTLLMICKKND